MTDLEFAGYVKPVSEGEPFGERQLIDLGFGHDLSRVQPAAASIALWRGPVCEGYPHGYQAAVAYDAGGEEVGRAFVGLDESGEPLHLSETLDAVLDAVGRGDFEQRRELPDTPDPVYDTVDGVWWRSDDAATFASKGGGAAATEDHGGFSEEELSRGAALRLWHPHYSSSLSSFIYHYWELFDGDGAKIGEKMYAEDIRSD